MPAMQHQGCSVGEVEGGVGIAAAQGEQLASLEQLVVAEAPILPAEHQGAGAPGLGQPAQGRLRCLQG